MAFRDWFYDQNFTWNRIFVKDDLENAWNAAAERGDDLARRFQILEVALGKASGPPHETLAYFEAAIRKINLGILDPLNHDPNKEGE